MNNEQKKYELKLKMLAAIEAQTIDQAFESLTRRQWSGGYLLCCPREFQSRIGIYPVLLSEQVGHNQTTVRRYLLELAADGLIELFVSGSRTKTFSAPRQMQIDALNLVTRFVQMQGFEICSIRDDQTKKQRPNPPSRDGLPKTMDALRKVIGGAA